MNPSFLKLFRDLVARRIDIENHYRERDGASASQRVHEWQKELNRRWERWATAEYSVRDWLGRTGGAGPADREDEGSEPGEPLQWAVRAAA